jgi:hypothetical protein
MAYSLLTGQTGYSFRNAPVSVGAGEIFALPASLSNLVWINSFGVSPSSISLVLETSDDQSNWSIVRSSLQTSDNSLSVNVNAKFARVRIVSATGGSGFSSSLSAQAFSTGLVSNQASIVNPLIGEWTPIIGGLTSESGQTYANRSGRSIKIDRLVSLYAYIQLSAKGTITGEVVIKGFPFPISNEANHYGALIVPYFATMAVNFSSLGGYADPGSTLAKLRGIKTPFTSIGAVAAADITDTTQLLVSMNYLTDV